jgi:DNA repair exonuclease SbcCD ATPase subunit
VEWDSNQNWTRSSLLIGAIALAGLGIWQASPIANADVGGKPAPLKTITVPQTQEPLKTFSVNQPLVGGTKRLKINISVSNPQDLKVRENDLVSAGQILADQDQERGKLEGQKRQLQLAIARIAGESIFEPPPPKPVPEVSKLPAANYAEQEAAIKAAELKLDQARRTYDLQLGADKNPIIESASTSSAGAQVDQASDAVSLQQRKLDAIATMKDLPPEIIPHEQEVLKRKQEELQQAQSKLELEKSKLEAAKSARAEKLKTLADAVEAAAADHALAIGRLQAAKDKRAYDEYQHSVTMARRTEELNQAQQNYSRQQQDLTEQRRNREFQLAQLKEKIGSLDERIGQLSTIRSPYSGVIKRVKEVKQSNNTLNFELTLISGNLQHSSSPAVSATSVTNAIPSRSVPNPKQ